MSEPVKYINSTPPEMNLAHATLPNHIESLITPGRNVACVYADNTLEHALLVLIKSGYSAVPVLGPHGTVHGTVSKTNILDAILEIDKIEINKLSELTVAQVRDESVPYLKPTDSFQRALDLLINRPFLCVRDESEHFFGILTRRSMLIEVANQLRSQHRSQ